MVYSASAVLAWHDFGDRGYYLKRQLFFAGLGCVVMWMAAKINFSWLREKTTALLIASFVLLTLVLIPGIGVIRGGARSWLGIGSFGIQPSEFMKLAIILFLAKWLSDRVGTIDRFTVTLLPALALVGLAFGLIMMQPDLGTGAVLVGSAMLMIYMAGAQLRHFVMLGAVGLAGLVGLIAAAPYRLKRIAAFLDPWQDPLGAGYQSIQSLYAIGPGGLAGLGLGQSRQKFSYLPEPQTDFIFSILAEETGFLGSAAVIILFSLLLWRGLRIAMRAPDGFTGLAAAGITMMIILQAFMNIGVVTGLLPVTGITLPLISYGGSSLTLTLAALGLLLNISRKVR